LRGWIEQAQMNNMNNWVARKRPGWVTLAGNDVRLEPLDWLRHGQHLFAAVAGKENSALWDYMPIGPFVDYEAFRQTLERSISGQGWETLVIIDAASHQVLGMASYMRIREEHGSVEIGCVAFGDQLKQTTHATEALLLMAAHVFDDLGYRRYEWKCNNANLASKRAAQRFCFVFEGIFRNDMVSKGESRDTAWYSIMDSEWPALRSALAAWLDPSNFDQQRQQIMRLEAFRAGC
jgi:RimJ/RimL family protein N-acetyltransferase